MSVDRLFDRIAKSLIDVVIVDECLHGHWLQLLFKRIGRDLDARAYPTPGVTQSMLVII